MSTTIEQFAGELHEVMCRSDHNGGCGWPYSDRAFFIRRATEMRTLGVSDAKAIAIVEVATRSRYVD
jgi:hypothetical protein